MKANALTDAVTPEHLSTVHLEDGNELVYRVWPARVKRTGTMVLVNGLMSHSAWFRNLAEFLCEQGLHVVGADRRGSGENAPWRGDIPSREALIADLAQIIERESSDDNELWLLGWCWGALPAINMALELGSRLSGLLLVAPGLFPSENLSNRMAAMLTKDRTADPSTPSVPSPLTCEMFSDRRDIQDLVRNDLLAQRSFSSRFFHVSSELSVIAKVRLAQLSAPVLLILPEQDETIDQQKTLTSFARVRSSITVRTMPGHHAIQLEAPRELANELSAWITTQCAQKQQVC